MYITISFYSGSRRMLEENLSLFKTHLMLCLRLWPPTVSCARQNMHRACTTQGCTADCTTNCTRHTNVLWSTLCAVLQSLWLRLIRIRNLITKMISRSLPPEFSFSCRGLSHDLKRLRIPWYHQPETCFHHHCQFDQHWKHLRIHKKCKFYSTLKKCSKHLTIDVYLSFLV